VRSPMHASASRRHRRAYLWRRSETRSWRKAVIPVAWHLRLRGTYGYGMRARAIADSGPATKDATIYSRSLCQPSRTMTRLAQTRQSKVTAMAQAVSLLLSCLVRGRASFGSWQILNTCISSSQEFSMEPLSRRSVLEGIGGAVALSVPAVGDS
jgi:hypothetical protein